MKKRQQRQILALALAALMTAPAACLPAYAAGAGEETTIAYEAMEQRDQNTKVFQKNDGSFVSVVSGAPVHYQKDGRWTEIDNTLEQAKTQDGDTVLTNKSNPYDVELPQRIGPDKPIVLKQDGYALSFVMEDIRTAKADVEKQKPAPDASEAEKRAGFEKRSGTVTYDGVQKDTDLQYIVTANRLTENIILDKAPKEAVSYRFTLRADGLNAAQQADKSILFTNEAGETVFMIPAPYMQDAEYERSEDVESVLAANEDGSWTLVYTPSLTWLQDEARQYPVKIDPDVRLPLYTLGDDMKPLDTYVDSSRPNENFAGSDLLSVSNMAGQEQKIYVEHAMRFFDLMKKNVVSAAMRYHLAGSVRFTPEAKAGLYIISDKTWDPEKVTYANQPNCFELPLDTAGLTDEYLRFDVTKVLRGLSNGINYLSRMSDPIIPSGGFMIDIVDPAGREGRSFYDGQFSVYPEYAPTFEVNYMLTTGLSNGYDTHQWDLGQGGKVTLNDFTTYFSIDREEIGIADARMPVQIRRYFDTGKASISFLNEFGQESPYGAYWQTNYDRQLTYQDKMFLKGPLGNSTENSDNYATAAVPCYQYLDGDGTVYEFINSGMVENGLEKWIPNRTPVSSQKELVLYVPQATADRTDCTTVKILEEQATKLEFDAKGRMIRMTDLTQADTAVSVVYAPGNENAGIDKIVDSEGREYRFEYSEASSGTRLLESIACYDAQGNPVVIKDAQGADVPYRIAYEYTPQSSAFLTKTTFPNGTVLVNTEDTNITVFPSTMQGSDGMKIRFDYIDGLSGGFHTTLVELTQGENTLDHLEMVMFDNNQVVFITRGEYYITKQFDDWGQLVNVFSNEGELLAFRKPDGELQEVVTPETSTDSFEGAPFDLSWGETGGLFMQTGDQAYTGAKSLMMINNGFIRNEQALTGHRFQYAAQFKTPASTAGIGGRIMVTGKDAQGSIVYTHESPTVSNTNGQWVMASVDCAFPENVVSMSVALESVGAGLLYVDDFTQSKLGFSLEENLVQNPDFTTDTSTSSDWSVTPGAEVF